MENAAAAGFQYVQEHPHAFHMFVRDVTDPEISERQEALRRSAVTAMADVMEMEPPETREGMTRQHTEQLAEMIVAGYYALADWWLRNPDFPRAEVVRSMLQFMWLGLGRLQDGDALGPDPRRERPHGRRNSLAVTERRPIKVLGIDPGTAATGYGVVEARGQRLSTVCGGVITTARGRAAGAAARSDLRATGRAARRALARRRSRSRTSSSAATCARRSPSARHEASCSAPPACATPVLHLHAPGGKARRLRQPAGSQGPGPADGGRTAGARAAPSRTMRQMRSRWRSATLPGQTCGLRTANCELPQRRPGRRENTNL